MFSDGFGEIPYSMQSSFDMSFPNEGLGASLGADTVPAPAIPPSQQYDAGLSSRLVSGSLQLPRQNVTAAVPGMDAASAAMQAEARAAYANVSSVPLDAMPPSMLQKMAPGVFIGANGAGSRSLSPVLGSSENVQRPDPSGQLTSANVHMTQDNGSGLGLGAQAQALELMLAKQAQAAGATGNNQDLQVRYTLALAHNLVSQKALANATPCVSVLPAYS